MEKAVLRNIDPTWRSRLATACGTLFKSSNNPEIRLLAERAQNYLSFTGLSKKPEQEEIDALVASQFVSDKIKLVKYLFKNDSLLNEDIISTLLDNTDRNVKSAAITLAGNLRTPKMINKLISLLESPEYYNTAENVLLDIGDKVLPALNEYFEKSMQPPAILLRIIELYAKFGSAPARAALMNNINYPNRDIQQAVIAALYFCKFQATRSEPRPRAHQQHRESV